MHRRMGAGSALRVAMGARSAPHSAAVAARSTPHVAVMGVELPRALPLGRCIRPAHRRWGGAFSPHVATVGGGFAPRAIIEYLDR